MMAALVAAVHKVTKGVSLQSSILYHSCLCLNYSITEVDALYPPTFPSLATITTATPAAATTHTILIVLGGVFCTQVCEGLT